MSNVRQAFQQGADANRDKLINALLETAEAKKDYSAMCSCGRRVKVKVPDHGARVRAVEKLVELGYGRASQEDADKAQSRKTQDTLRSLESMSDQELAALAGQGT